MDNSCGCLTERKTVRSSEDKENMVKRLSRIEGQIRGIKEMLINDCYCIDILTQVSAASGALSAFSRGLISNHIRNCVVNDAREGSYEKLEELIQAIDKMIR